MSTGTPTQNRTPDTPRRSLLALIETRDVGTHFQPIVDLQSGSIVGFEALSRPGKATGFGDPGELFEAAEREQLLWPLEELTRLAAFEAAANWPADMLLFLNCTPDVFADERFADSLAQAVSRADSVVPDRIVLEITELSREQATPGLAEQARRLKSGGFQIAIDDVGAGTSGLNRIMLLRPHWLKLDREFIQRIDQDPFKQNLVRFFVHFARLGGVSILAEGIETREELVTVAGLGVRFGQGFFLGRPCPREQTASPGYGAAVHDRWSEVQAIVSAAPGSTPLRRLCRPVWEVQAVTLVGEVAARLLRDPTQSGVVVVDGRRFVGWCARGRVLDEARAGAGRRPIAAVASDGVCPISPEATIQEGLQLVCVRDEEHVAEPLVIADGGEILGIVKLRDLLQIAAAETQSTQMGRAPLTGLPARASADQHIGALIRQGEGGAAEQLHGGSLGDAAMIDIRNFDAYNATFGYELGNKLLRELAELIKTIVVQDEPGVFLAHLGDDRFLLTAPPGVLLPRLGALMAEFDRGFAPRRPAGDPLSDDQSQPGDPVAGAPGSTGPAPSPSLYSALHSAIPCAGLTLRVLHMPGVFNRLRNVRDLYRLEQQLRQRLRHEEDSGEAKSVLVSDIRFDGARTERKTA